MQTIDNYKFAGKKAIVRVDFNVPLDENGKITDDTRIRGALPTLKKILAERPDFKYVADVAPDCAAELKEKFADRVFFTPKKLGAQTEEANINAGVAAVNQIMDFLENGLHDGNKRFKVNK